MLDNSGCAGREGEGRERGVVRVGGGRGIERGVVRVGGGWGSRRERGVVREGGERGVVRKELRSEQNPKMRHHDY